MGKNLGRSRSGQSLVELVIAMGIGVIVALTMATIFAFGIDQFNNLVEQNRAEESLLQSAFLMKSYLSQAVKIQCSLGNTGGGLASPPNYRSGVLGLSATGPIPGGISLYDDKSPPVGDATCSNGFARGIIDCDATPNAATNRNLAPPGTPLPLSANHRWNPGTLNPFAIFVRDEGGSVLGTQDSTTGGGNAGQSYFIPTGIYFAPPTVGAVGVPGQSGILSFTQNAPGAAVTTQATVQWDHIVDVGVIGPRNGLTTTPGPLQVQVSGGTGGCAYNVNNLESMQIRIVARYITYRHRGIISYQPWNSLTPNPLWANYRDIEIAVPIAFRNSFLGVSATGTGSAERIYGGMYFFRFTSPPTSAFDF